MPPRQPEQEKEVLDWIEAVMGESLPKGDFEEILKNGVVLCKLMNKISPGSIPKFKESGPAFLLMENVQSFLTAMKKYGVPDEEVFQTPDLFEARNIPQVNNFLISAPSYGFFTYSNHNALAKTGRFSTNTFNVFVLVKRSP